MTHKKDIIKQVSDKLNLSERETTKTINTFLDTLINVIIKDERLELRGFGVFEVKQRKSKRIKNISTGELTQTKSYKDVEYKTSKTIKKLINPKIKPNRKRKKSI